MILNSPNQLKSFVDLEEVTDVNPPLFYFFLFGMKRNSLEIFCFMSGGLKTKITIIIDQPSVLLSSLLKSWVPKTKIILDPHDSEVRKSTAPPLFAGL